MSNQQQKIREYMKQQSLSRVRMAERMNVSIYTLDAYLQPDHAKGHRKLPERRLKQLQQQG